MHHRSGMVDHGTSTETGKVKLDFRSRVRNRCLLVHPTDGASCCADRATFMVSFWIDNLTNKDELLLKQRRFDEPAPLLLSRTLSEANSGEVARHPS